MGSSSIAYWQNAIAFALLGDDEGFRVHPIGVTQFAQRADLELIDSSQREPTDGYLLGSDDRDDCPRAQYPAGALRCL